jgi:hypothetical protein
MLDLDKGDAGAARAFDGAATIRNLSASWPAIETSHCRRVGFWRERSPRVFGSRTGVGPLVVMPDTNILIESGRSLPRWRVGCS